MAHLKDLIVNGPARILGKFMSPVFSDSVSMGRAEDTDIGVSSVALGYQVIASGEASHAEGVGTRATAQGSHAEGYFTVASGDYSHAEGGYLTQATGGYAHAEGENTLASGDWSHTEGQSTWASNSFAHAEGWGTVASGESSHAEGYGTVASGQAQHVQGKYNMTDSESEYAHIVGNGESDEYHSNAHTIDWYGNAWFSGDVYVGSLNGTNKDTGSKKLATENQIPAVYTAQECIAYSSDSGTCTPKAVQQGAKQFAIPRVGYTSNTDKGNTTDKAIVRFNGTESDVQDSKIIIEDVTNTANTSKKAQVIAIPAEGNKKMVYGYCTDQVDGTSFIGGLFDKTATAYPYASGLAIGGTSGNLLWKGQKVVTANEVPTGFTMSATANDDDIVVLTGSGGTNSVSYTANHAKKGPSTNFTHSNTASAFSVPNISVDTYGHTTAVANGQKFILADTLPTTVTNGAICIVY